MPFAQGDATVAVRGARRGDGMDIRQTRLAVALLVPLALTTCTKDARVRTQAPAASAAGTTAAGTIPADATAADALASADAGAALLP
ncbi:MAG: hypothetical protein H7Y19_03260, partial [Luteimonas sp.]|nr:hypothetical protein [Luteimonas sp.]